MPPVSAAISMMIALSLINAPLVATAALTIVVAGWFGLDVLRNGIHFFRPRGETRWPAGAAALGNLAVVLLLLFARGWVLTWVVTIAGALRIAGIAWNILVAPITAATEAHEEVIAELGLQDDPEAVSMAEEIDTAQCARAPIDRGWTLSFIAVLLGIHIGRMGTGGTFLGLISPAAAVVGVKVEPSAHRVRLIPYGINGRLALGDVASSGGLRPAGTTDRTPLEWVVPMK
jgi:hypothetical protein